MALSSICSRRHPAEPSNLILEIDAAGVSRALVEQEVVGNDDDLGERNGGAGGVVRTGAATTAQRGQVLDVADR